MGTIMTSILSAIGGAIVGAALALIKTLWKRQKSYDLAIKATTHDAYFRQCRAILKCGDVTEDELENLEYLYGAYHSLGLNGMGDNLYKRCKELPLMKGVR